MIGRRNAGTYSAGIEGSFIMRYLKSLSAVSLLALISAVLPSSAGAADNNVQRRSKLTISEPTEIPGTLLQPGTYFVKVMDFQDEKLIVQFMNADETKVIATVLAMRDRRVMTDDAQTGFTYFQRSPDGPAALKMSARSSVIPAARPRSGTSPGSSGRPRL